MAEYQCPKANGNAEEHNEFRIYGAVENMTRVDIDQDGETLDYEGGDIEWDDTAEMECLGCNYRGKITEFKTEG